MDNHYHLLMEMKEDFISGESLEISRNSPCKMSMGIIGQRIAYDMYKCMEVGNQKHQHMSI